MFHPPAPHLGDERRRRRFRDRPAGEGAGADHLSAKFAPDPAVPHLAVKALAGDTRQQTLKVHVERVPRAALRRIAIHVAVGVDLDQDQAAIGPRDPIDQRRVECAQLGHVRYGRERRRHIERDHPGERDREPARTAEPQHEARERGSGEERNHVLDAIEHRP